MLKLLPAPRPLGPAEVSLGEASSPGLPSEAADSRRTMEFIMFDTQDDKNVVIYRPYTTTKDGRRIWAKWYGERAFRIEVGPSSKTTA